MMTFGEYRKQAASFSTLLKDRDEWLVSDISLHRDADTLGESNFCVVERDLEAYSDGDVEILEFGHWACGWVKHIFVRPGSEAAKCIEKWEGALANYPIASEEDYSDLQWSTAFDRWGSYTPEGRVRALRQGDDRHFTFNTFADMLACVRSGDLSCLNDVSSFLGE